MGFDAFAEPLIVVSILTFGVVWNRRRGPSKLWNGSPLSSPLLGGANSEPQYRDRVVLGKIVKSRNTKRWERSLVSRVLDYFPFLVEVWYWLLIYWVSWILEA